MEAAAMTITFADLSRLAGVIVALWALYKVIIEIIRAINNHHDKEQRWDQTEENLRKERQDDVCRYNEQLQAIHKRQDDIRTDFEAKVQEVKAEQYVIIDCLKAVLDGLHQQGCNGAVTKAIRDLDKYLNERAHE